MMELLLLEGRPPYPTSTNHQWIKFIKELAYAPKKDRAASTLQRFWRARLPPTAEQPAVDIPQVNSHTEMTSTIVRDRSNARSENLLATTIALSLLGAVLLSRPAPSSIAQQHQVIKVPFDQSGAIRSTTREYASASPIPILDTGCYFRGEQASPTSFGIISAATTHAASKYDDRSAPSVESSIVYGITVDSVADMIPPFLPPPEPPPLQNATVDADLD